MLTRIREQRDVDYVILWKVDRFARNRRDDANMLFEIETSGARLISATENIDQTPAGRLMHGMLASFAEYYSRNLANEVVKGATQKAKRGGTPNVAPLGYLNIIERIDGRDIRTIALDPERAPLIRWAFETYATGYYSLADLDALLAARGLRTKGNRRYSSRPLNQSSIHRMLTNDYYAGVVTYRGKKYPGRHPELVSRTLFDRVQDILHAHNRSGERDRKRSHYLKGTLYCGECGRRLTFSENTGNGGAYQYFVCAQKQHKRCTQRYKRAEHVEALIERYYATVVLSETRRARVRQAIRTELARMSATSENELRRCNGVLAELKTQERKLLDAHYQDRVSSELYAEESARIAREREVTEAIAARLNVEFSDITNNLELALTLVSDIQRAYKASPPHIRRLLNQAIFVRIDLRDGEEIEGRLAEPFASLLDNCLFETVEADENVPASIANGKGPDPWGSGPLALGSIRAKVVGETGFEPATARPPAGSFQSDLSRIVRKHCDCVWLVRLGSRQNGT